MNIPVPSNYEMDLLKDWLMDMKNHELKFQKSWLNIETINLIKHCCNILLQDIHVFLISLGVMEDYIREKNKKQSFIDDPVLAIVTAVFISSKYAGNQDLKIKSTEDLLLSLTGQIYGARAIELQEIEILTTLHNNLPLGSVADDLTTLLTKFERHYQIRVSLIPACLDVLEFIYLTRDTWFLELKEIYNVGSDARIVFNGLMQSRFYVPICVLGYVMKFSAYNNILDVDNLLKHLSSKVHIHTDHILALINKLREVFLRISDHE